MSNPLMRLEAATLLDAAKKLEDPPVVSMPALLEIERLDSDLSRKFKDKLKIQSSLTRSLVSFQANKARAVYRWYKYKEAFSASLIEHLLSQYTITAGKILDPFAGSGSTGCACALEGFDFIGIEQSQEYVEIAKARIGHWREAQMEIA